MVVSAMVDAAFVVGVVHGVHCTWYWYTLTFFCFAYSNLTAMAGTHVLGRSDILAAATGMSSWSGFDWGRVMKTFWMKRSLI